MPRGKRKATNEAKPKTPEQKKRRGRPKKEAPAATEKTAPAAEPKKATYAETPERVGSEVAEEKPITRTATAKDGCRKVERQITDTVGITFRVEGTEPPAVGDFIHVKVDNGEEFDLVAKAVRPRKQGGFTVWCFLRTKDEEGKRIKDGARFRACRLRWCSVSF